jgi:hypothetical protein
MTKLTRKEAVEILTKLIGCGNCGRFDLYGESHDSEHTRGWHKFNCPHCQHSMKFPVFGEEAAAKTAA